MKLVLLMCALFVAGQTFSDPEVVNQADGASGDPVPVAHEQPALEVSPASGSIDDFYGLRRLKLPELDFIYVQHPLSPTDETYPKWNPADSACALHPEIAKNLAIDAVKRSIPEVITCVAHDIALKSRPSCSDTFWYYSVKLDLDYENRVALALTTINVGINGYVPPIDRMTPDEWEKYAEVQKEKMTNVAEAWLRETYKLIPTPELKKRLETSVYQTTMSYSTDLNSLGVNYYHPQSIDLSTKHLPADWDLPPASSTNSVFLWGQKNFGHETIMNVLVQVSGEPSENPWYVYIAFDDNTDFSGTQPVVTERRGSRDVAEFKIKYRDGSIRPYKISVYPNTLNPTPEMTYYRQSVLTGIIDLPKGSHRIVLCDDDADGLYSDLASTAVIVDAGDAERSPDAGRFSGTSAINFGDSGYYIIDVSDDGSIVRFHPASYGVLEGKVTCSVSKSPIPDAKVMISKPEFEMITDGDGKYKLDIPIGEYFYTRITAPGYVPLHDRRPRTVKAGRPCRFDATLDPAVPPDRGKLTLSIGDSYHFLSGELHKYSGGDFYLGYSDGMPQFFSNNFLQQGVQDLGEVDTDLEEIVPPTKEYYAYGVPVIDGHTYVSPAKEGEDGSYIIFKVLEVKDDHSCEIEFVYKAGSNT